MAKPKQKATGSAPSSSTPALPPPTSPLLTMISSKKSSADIIRTLGRLTVGDVLKARFPAISYLKRLHGTERIETVLTIMVIETSGYFEAAIPEAQARQLAAEIETAYFYLSLEDIYVALQGLKHTGQYGKLTPNKLLHHVAHYTAQRLELSAQRSLDEHLSQKDNRINHDDPDRRAQQIRDNEAFKQFQENYKAKNQPPTTNN